MPNTIGRKNDIFDSRRIKTIATGAGGLSNSVTAVAGMIPHELDGLYHTISGVVNGTAYIIRGSGTSDFVLGTIQDADLPSTLSRTPGTLNANTTNSAASPHTHVITSASPAFTFGTAAAIGTAAGFVRSDATLLAFDSTVPGTLVAGTSSTGTATVTARRDHIHGVSTGTPAIAFGTAGAIGTATSLLRSDCTIAAFDSTNPSSIGTAATPGTSSTAARRDHVHNLHLTIPSGDHATHGITIPLTANENHAIGDVCFINSGGSAQLIDADGTATMNGVAMCADASVAGSASGNYLIFGIARDDTWNWTTGGLVYGGTAGTTGNTLTQTAPSGTSDVIQIFGVALSADVMLFIPQLAQVEHT